MTAAGASPRIPASRLARCPRASRPPAAHTAAELARLQQLLRAARADTIAIGHGRHPASVAAARALAAAWAGAGGTVLDLVSYPADAASWLRPARRLASSQPDAWVIADNPAGCAQLARRLAGEPGWAAARTFGSASVATADLISLAGPGVLDGMTGATPAGGTWSIEADQLTRLPAVIHAQRANPAP
jgi:ABC-type branched-subunit amino acid transport system substrate-binding protein